MMESLPMPSSLIGEPSLTAAAANQLSMRQRRQALLWLAGGAMALPAVSRAATGSCVATPSEMAGPFPGDGTNRWLTGRHNALILPGIERPDIRASLAGGRSVAEGAPLEMRLKLVSARDCAPLKGWSVYLWQCDAAGRYSMYDDELAKEDHLRGVQRSDADGELRFTSVFPGCYPGRMPHVHFHVYAPGALHAPRLTSQLAFEPEVCERVYRSNTYAGSRQPFAGLSFARDRIFRDGVDRQMLRTAEQSGQLLSQITIAVDVG
jgi:protocatechuate 3,4-dioxygenase beta subunit